MTDLRPTPRAGLLAPAARAPVEPQRFSAFDDLVRGFLLSKRSPKTRDAYAADLASWLTFCARLDLHPLAAGLHHPAPYLRPPPRRAPGLGSPFTDVERPRPGDEHATSRLSTAERRQLRAAARAD